MQISALLLLALTVTELVLLFVVIAFYLRLRKSEALIARMQTKPEEFLNKLRSTLNKLLKQADEYARSPQFLRQVIITGSRQGKSVKELSRATGLSIDEVELIIDQSGT